MREICTKDGAITFSGDKGWDFSDSLVIVAASEVDYSLAHGSSSRFQGIIHSRPCLSLDVDYVVMRIDLA